MMETQVFTVIGNTRFDQKGNDVSIDIEAKTQGEARVKATSHMNFITKVEKDGVVLYLNKNA